MKWPWSKSESSTALVKQEALSAPATLTFEDFALGNAARAALDDTRFGKTIIAEVNGQRCELKVIQRDSSSVSQGVPAFWFARALEPGQMASMWQPFRESVWVQRAIKIISGPVGSVPPDFYPRNVQVGTSRRDVRSRSVIKSYRSSSGLAVKRSADAAIEVPQLSDFLREPVRGLSYADFVEATIGWLKMEECFWLLSDSTLVPFPQAKSRKPDPIIIAQPYRMRHILGDDGELAGWTYQDVLGKQWTLLPDQVIHIRGWNPYHQFRGLGEYPSAQIAAEGDWLAGKFSRNLMGNNGDTGPFIIAKNGIPTDPQRDQIIAALREKRHAQLRGEFKPMFLTGDIEVQDPKIGSVDAPFIQQRIEARHEIAAAFGIPMSMFDLKAAYSIGADSDIFWLICFTCIPTGAKLAGGLERLAKKLFGLDLEVLLDWDQHPVIQAARRARLKDADGLFSKGMPMRQISDYLDLSLPEYEGDDIGYLPINLTPAVPTEPDDTTQTPLKPDDFSEVPTESGNPDAPEPVQEMLSALRGCSHPSHSSHASHRSPKNKQLWENHMRRRSAATKLLQSKASKVFNDFRVKALKKLDATYGRKSIEGVTSRSLLDVIFSKDDFGSALTEALRNPIHAALESSVADLMSEIGRADDPWKMPPADAIKFIRSRENKISGVSETAFSQLKTALESAVKAGKNIDEIAGDIKGVFNGLSRYEARKIAMTEVCALDGFARHEGMKGAGIELKSWLSSHGPNVRPAHEAAEARYEAHPIPLEDPFVVGGENLMYPGDPAGSAANVINCQCIQLACTNKGEQE